MFEHEIDLRLQGQESSLSISMDDMFDCDSLALAFAAAYRDTYGYTPTDAVEVVSLRMRSFGRHSDGHWRPVRQGA